MQAPGVPIPHNGRLVRQAQACAAAGRAQGQRGLSRVVQQADLGEASATRPADAGAFLPGMWQAGVPHPGCGGGSHRAVPGRLGAVRELW